MDMTNDDPVEKNENGELNIISGTYKRTEEDLYCGGTVTNFGGKTVIKNAAREPEIVDLINMLNK